MTIRQAGVSTQPAEARRRMDPALTPEQEIVRRPARGAGQEPRPGRGPGRSGGTAGLRRGAVAPARASSRGCPGWPCPSEYGGTGLGGSSSPWPARRPAGYCCPRRCWPPRCWPPGRSAALGDPDAARDTAARRSPPAAGPPRWSCPERPRWPRPGARPAHGALPGDARRAAAAREASRPSP